MSTREENNGEEPKELDYNEEKDQLEEKQEEAEERETTNQVF
jgi:hypothetical protein